MGRSPCCAKAGLKKGPWTPDEDRKLLSYIQQHGGHGSWRALPPKAGLERCGKSCRLRWTNYLRPDIKRGKFSLQEEQTIIQLHALLGNRWSAIASHLPKRTDNEIKNYWNTHLKKRLAKMGIDPTTHKLASHALGSGQSKDSANLSHMAQWESARLEAEARIVRESKLAYDQLSNKATIAAPPPPPPPPPPAAAKPPCLDILRVWQGTWTKPNTKDIDTTISNASSNKSLELPSSMLTLSDKMITATHNVGLIHESAFVSDDNCMKITNGNDYGDKGITGMQLLNTMTTDPIDSTNYNFSDSVKFTNLLECYIDDLPPGIGCPAASTGPTSDDVLFEDIKVSYWTNILTSVSSPMDSPIF